MFSIERLSSVNSKSSTQRTSCRRQCHRQFVLKVSTQYINIEKSCQGLGSIHHHHHQRRSESRNRHHRTTSFDKSHETLSGPLLQDRRSSTYHRSTGEDCELVCMSMCLRYFPSVSPCAARSPLIAVLIKFVGGSTKQTWNGSPSNFCR